MVLTNDTHGFECISGFSTLVWYYITRDVNAHALLVSVLAATLDT